MTGGARASIVFAGSPNVSATLLDSSGAVVGTNAAGTPESKQMFRTIAVERAVTAGTWRLKLENREAAETSVLLAAFADPNPLRFSFTTGRPTPAGQILLEAGLTNNGSPLAGAVVRAKVQSEDGRTIELTLLDDGTHGDGSAGDGVYGVSIDRPAEGEYAIEAVAETNGQRLVAESSLSVGTTAPGTTRAKPAAGRATR
jgi:hypothetical protein